MSKDEKNAAEKARLEKEQAERERHEKEQAEKKEADKNAGNKARAATKGFLVNYHFKALGKTYAPGETLPFRVAEEVADNANLSQEQFFAKYVGADKALSEPNT